MMNYFLCMNIVLIISNAVPHGPRSSSGLDPEFEAMFNQADRKVKESLANLKPATSPRLTAKGTMCGRVWIGRWPYHLSPFTSSLVSNSSQKIGFEIELTTSFLLISA